MDQVKKMDCRANGEVLLGVRRPSQPNFCQRPSPSIKMDSPWGDHNGERKEHAQ